jgi:hypothetical protein
MPSASARRAATVTEISTPAEPVQSPAKPDAADEAAEFRRAAQKHAGEALEALAKLMREANSEAVRVSAANALIDRAYGRAAQAVRVDGETAEDGQAVSLTFTWLDPVKS